jgi:hypothetical protein
MTMQLLLKKALVGKTLPRNPKRRRPVRCPDTPGPWYAFDTRCGRVARQSNVLPNAWKRAGNLYGYNTANEAMCA